MSELPRAALLFLPFPVTGLATQDEGECPQSSFRDLTFAFDAGPVLALVEQGDRMVDPPQAVRRALEQGALDVVLHFAPPLAEHVPKADVSDGVTHLELLQHSVVVSRDAFDIEHNGHVQDRSGRTQ